jgi:hypothetical protein
MSGVACPACGVEVFSSANTEEEAERRLNNHMALAHGPSKRLEPPTELFIMTQRYKVHHVPDRGALLVHGGPEENEVGKNALGYSNNGTQEITIRTQPAVSHDAERDTLLHEVLHMVFAHTAIAERLTEVECEDLIGRLSPAILSVMRENPAFVEYLMEADSRG